VSVVIARGLLVLIASQAWRCVSALADSETGTSSEAVSADDNSGVATLTWDSDGNLGKVKIVTLFHVTSFCVTPFHVMSILLTAVTL
jgi:hypothetical protein